MASSETTSTVRVKADTGSHVVKFWGYSHTKGTGLGKFICSDVFTIGSYDWVIQFYPNGNSIENKGFLSFFLVLKKGPVNVNAKFTFTVLQKNGLPFNMSFESKYFTFRRIRDCSSSSGCAKFAQRSEFEASDYLQDDAFQVKCTVTIQKGLYRQKTTPYSNPIQSSYFRQQFIHLLNSGVAADVTFVVDGHKIKAHRKLIASRSIVFDKMLFGGMKESLTETIEIQEMEAPVFKCMLHFIYCDSFPEWEENDPISDSDDKIHMVQHLVDAANRFALGSLKDLCEELLIKNLSKTTIETASALAERCNCNKLKEECQRFNDERI